MIVFIYLNPFYRLKRVIMSALLRFKVLREGQIITIITNYAFILLLLILNIFLQVEKNYNECFFKADGTEEGSNYPHHNKSTLSYLFFFFFVYLNHFYGPRRIAMSVFSMFTVEKKCQIILIITNYSLLLLFLISNNFYRPRTVIMSACWVTVQKKG